MNAKPKSFLNYLQRTYSPPEETIEMAKMDSENPLLDRFVQQQLQEFETVREEFIRAKQQQEEKKKDKEDWSGEMRIYDIKMKVIEARNKISDNYSQYLESWGRDSIMHNRLHQFIDSSPIPVIGGVIGGRTTGLVFDVEPSEPEEPQS
jgi:hypothetical protein